MQRYQSPHEKQLVLLLHRQCKPIDNTPQNFQQLPDPRMPLRLKYKSIENCQRTQCNGAAARRRSGGGARRRRVGVLLVGLAGVGAGVLCGRRGRHPRKMLASIVRTSPPHADRIERRSATDKSTSSELGVWPVASFSLANFRVIGEVEGEEKQSGACGMKSRLLSPTGRSLNTGRHSTAAEPADRAEKEGIGLGVRG
ncbi:uncharacterized protein A4U43_C03F19940 [Asparagus officinalis]|uniref:Uncharacterized protein n=1 Tax=Asparagus officinalis TaxID=4686 RepID=A0A5P1FGN4_ASPOF|nr:uncharacterized protein A4U43_C03F19940 [Asparagus officinalis]